jgi:tetratricopeptide (TPR) repeat protein
MFTNERKHKAHAVNGKLAVAILLLAGGSSLAEQTSPSAYRMAVIKDDAYGRVMMSGDYHKGIEKISSYRYKKGRTFAAQNNLCVAYTLTREFADATSACDTALSISERYVRHRSSPISPFTSRDLALAYSNRGVLRAVTGDADGARQDFESAARANTDMQAANENLARLKASQATAVSSL